MILFYVALGGALGAVGRLVLGGWVDRAAGTGFPWGTLVVNLLGCFLIGMTIRWLDSSAVGPELRAMMTVGLLGAFTTFSTYGLEIHTLLRGGDSVRAFLYAGGSVVLGVAGVAVGLAAAGLLMPGRG